MKNNVVILGGGVAGMSAAHELIERGYEVTVLEKKKYLPGGKARSIPIEGSASDGRQLLPGEHGFRFFPGFYKHITETMSRIPYKGNKLGVFDNLVESPNIMLARMGFVPIIMPGHLPRSLEDLKEIFNDLFRVKTGLKPGESHVIALKIWQLMTSCKERRDNEYEQRSWLEFTEAEKYSENYRTLFVDGLTRTLVAAKAETCNTRTNGNVLLQLLFHFNNKGVPNDRILDGPTNDVWLFPWLEYLQQKGVRYLFDQEVSAIELMDGRIHGIGVSSEESDVLKFYSGDYYLCALPVERAASLFKNQEILKMDPTLNDVITLSGDVAWMNGIQYFLKEDVQINNGHIIMADTPWALTAISQAQFWKNTNLGKDYGQGDVKGIISVDISDWDKPGVLHPPLPAKDCIKKSVILDVWEQMKRSLNSTGKIYIEDSNFKMAFLDDSIIFSDDLFSLDKASTNPRMNEKAKYGSNLVTRNDEPLLVNKINTWHLRHEARTNIPNLYLSSDYVKTNTDLATMEGANEAARRAVNEILRDSKSVKDECRIWELYEPDWLNFHKWLDLRRFRKNKVWKNYSPWLILVYKLFFWLQKNKMNRNDQ